MLLNRFSIPLLTKKIQRLFVSLTCVTLLISSPIINAEQTTKSNNEPFISAESAIIMDGDTGQIIYSKNSDQIMFPASITKVMTALLAIETLKPEDTLTFSHDSVFNIGQGSSHIGMREGETITIDQALHGLLLMSANEVANGIAEKVSGTNDAFVDKMNQRAIELGATSTHFNNPHGYHDPEHTTTAKDIALITKQLILSEYFLKIEKAATYNIEPTNLCDETRYLYQQHKMLNPLNSATIYRADVIAGKTGFTDEAGYTLVTVARDENNQTFIVVLLKAGRDSFYDDTNALLDYGQEYFKKVTINTESYNKTIPVDYLDSESKKGLPEPIGDVTVQLKSPMTFLINNSMTLADLTEKATLPERLRYPLKEMDIIGEVTYYNGDLLVGKSELIISSTNLTLPLRVKVLGAEDSNNPRKISFPFLTFCLFLLILGVISFISYVLLMRYHNIKRRRKLQKNRFIHSEKSSK